MTSRKDYIGVNHVSIFNDENRLLSVKEFGPHAHSTGIAVPMERIGIECGVISLLRNGPYVNDVISTRNVTRQGSKLIIEYVAGTSALSFLEANGDTKQFSNAVFQLGRWIALVERYLWLHRRELFAGYYGVQRNIRSIMREIKGEPSMPGECDSVSLGDLNLNNLLFDSASLCPIDFEFCHISCAGRDAGQLSAHLDVLGFHDCREHLIRGYASEGGDTHLSESWRLVFYQYYKRKGRR